MSRRNLSAPQAIPSAVVSPAPSSLLPMTTVALIPAINEALSVGGVVADVLAAGVDRVVVIDNGSTDGTPEVASSAGATVIHEPRRGYGSACLAGIEWVRRQPVAPEVVVFLDADASDDVSDLPSLLAPIQADGAELVIGSRVRGQRAGRVEPGALLPQARWGNALACTLMRWRWGANFTDLGPFRVIRWPALDALGMVDQTFGWTVEMQVRAVRAGLACAEVPVAYRKRIGVSKITGTINGTVRAGAKILWTIGQHALRRDASPASSRAGRVQGATS